MADTTSLPQGYAWYEGIIVQVVTENFEARANLLDLLRQLFFATSTLGTAPFLLFGFELLFKLGDRAQYLKEDRLFRQDFWRRWGFCRRLRKPYWSKAQHPRHQTQSQQSDAALHAGS
jgi:hypothetical protein